MFPYSIYCIVSNNSTQNLHSRNTRLTNPSRSKSQGLKSRTAIPVSSFQSTPMQGNIHLKRRPAHQLLIGMSTPTQQNGLKLEKKVLSQLISPLIIGPKDEEMTKFYNDLKVAESLHATAATIIQGTSTPLLNLTCRTRYACSYTDRDGFRETRVNVHD